MTDLLKRENTQRLSEKTVEYMRSLGFDADGSPVTSEAKFIHDRVRALRLYLFEVARIEWKCDLRSYDLRPIVMGLFADEKLREEVFSEIAGWRGRSRESTHQHEEANCRTGNECLDHTESHAPIRRGAAYMRAKIELAHVLGHE